MIAVDTNILVYAHRADASWHEKADRALAGLAEGKSFWAIPWPCLYEFFAIVTHPRIFNPPTSARHALVQIRCWLESPTLILLTEGDDFFAVLEQALIESAVIGAVVHDARVAGLCIHHGIEKLWSADRDFSRFRKLRVENPLVK